MNYRTIFVYMVLLSVCLASVPGCGPKNSVVGRWRGMLPAANGGSAMMTVEFRPDGTEVQTIEGAGQNIRLEAKYDLQDGKLTHNVVRAEKNGQVVTAPQQSATFTYKVEGDTLTLGMPNTSSALLLKRLKD